MPKESFWHLTDIHALSSVNISNAAIFGLQKDLNIATGTKYNTALTVFFIPYVLLEVPAPTLGISR